MTSLVENLLSLARADGGAENIALTPIPVNDMFRSVKETWKNAMNQALLDFRVEIPGNDLIALGDSQGIPRLLSILLENASKYTPPGGRLRYLPQRMGSASSSQLLTRDWDRSRAPATDFRSLLSCNSSQRECSGGLRPGAFSRQVDC